MTTRLNRPRPLSKINSSIRRGAFPALALLALSLPFELDAPLLQLGPLAITNVEVLLGAFLGLAVLYLALSVDDRSRFLKAMPHSPLVVALLALFIIALVLSALLAPAYQGNALKAALRTLSGMALAAALPVVVRDKRDLIWPVGGLLAGGLIAAAIGAAEMVRNVDFLWLAPVRLTPTVAGPFIRLTGPFDYANQAAMLMEATAPLLMVLTWWLWATAENSRRRRVLAVVAGAASLFYLQAIILTFSRAAFATVFIANGALVVLLMLAAWRQRTSWSSLSLPFALLTGGVAVIVIVNLLLNPIFRLRLLSESDSAWYEAQIVTPRSLQMEAGQTQEVTVTIANEGVFTWHSAGSTPVHLAARWVQPDSGRELSHRPRWPLSEPVPPGERLTMQVPVKPPDEGGDYRLVWDMVEEHVTWFSAKSGNEAATMVAVVGAAAPVDEGPGSGSGDSDSFEAAWAFDAPIPGRRALWTAAFTLWRGEMWTGIGLDNFRLRYGEAMGFERWNDTIHTNNWYVETLVSVGLLGALPAFGLLALLLFDIVRVAWRAPRQQREPWVLAVAAGLLAYVVHGLLDYFLLFNATGLLFWLLVGLWLSLRRSDEEFRAEPR